MRDKRALLIGILLVIALGTYLNWEYCCRPDTVTWVTSEVPVTPVSENDFELSDPDGGFVYRHNDHFNFHSSEFRILPPLGRGVRVGVDSLKAYLESRPERTIAVTGLYHPDEKNTSDFTDLGRARAAQIRNYMIARGIKSRQIDYSGAIADSIKAYDSIYKGPVLFAFTGKSAAPVESLEAAVETLNADPLVIRFEWGESEIILSASERQKLDRIADFIARSEKGVCQVTGHTDNTSSAGFNNKLGLKRANFVKDYLVTQGIPQDRIITRSMGETDPVADNEKESGRALNRRTVVTISY